MRSGCSTRLAASSAPARGQGVEHNCHSNQGSRHMEQAGRRSPVKPWEGSSRCQGMERSEQNSSSNKNSPCSYKHHSAGLQDGKWIVLLSCSSCTSFHLLHLGFGSISPCWLLPVRRGTAFEGDRNCVSGSRSCFLLCSSFGEEVGISSFSECFR